MSPSDAILRFAEEPFPELPEPWLPGRRFIRPSFTLVLSPEPTHSIVARVRATADDLDATIAEVRAILRAHGYVACAWHIGPSCRPVEIARLLAERGFTPANRTPFEPQFTAMVLTHAPPVGAIGPGVETRLVRDCAEYLHVLREGLVAFGESEEAIAKWIDGASAGWDHESGIVRMTHVAFADGNFAGLGLVSYGPSALMLGGGVVIPAFQGRGVYRALVASRWRAAVAMGKPALTVHAGAQSRPILERCGFQEVCRVDLLLDPGLG
jgi:GNAT superfamily N-acetyltransferase